MATMDADMMRHHIRHDAVAHQAASDRFCVGTAFTTLGSKQSKEAESGKPKQRTTHGGYMREDAQVPDHPAREELLDLFREYTPEIVMEAYCSQSPGGMQ